MVSGLLAGLDARFIFVVGKGGVGKTTTAGATALALADTGRPTHLISTDPAHSLGDLFEQQLRGSPVRSPCSPHLWLEEFDASGYAREWFRTTSPALAELVEGGTYLDREDIAGFLDLALPGMDEAMAALRLAELDAGPSARIVVDTAPTGHTLRLLDATELVASWTAAFRAMAEKVRAVASALTHRSVRLAAEDTLDALEAAAARFEGQVLGRADFLVISTPAPVVRAETARLRAALESRSLHIVAELCTGGEPGVEGVLAVPHGPDIRGCEGLRRWGQSSIPQSTRPLRLKSGGAAPRSRVSELFEHELVLFVGKGGVGKSTCSAACALALAERRSVSLLSTDPAGSLAEVLGTADPAGTAVRRGALAVHQIEAQADFERFRSRYRGEVEQLFAGGGRRSAAELDLRVLESLWNVAPPGIDEIFALVGMLELGAGRETLIIDSAPTGHFLRLLELPGPALEWTRALMRILLKYRTVLDLDEMAERLVRFSKRLKELRMKVSDPERCAVALVTLDRPMVRAESARLEGALSRAGVPMPVRIHNRTDAAGPGPEPRPLVLAPRVEPAPVGAAALLEFFARWELLS